MSSISIPVCQVCKLIPRYNGNIFIVSRLDFSSFPASVFSIDQTMCTCICCYHWIKNELCQNVELNNWSPKVEIYKVSVIVSSVALKRFLLIIILYCHLPPSGSLLYCFTLSLAEITLLDNNVIIYKFVQDLHFFVTGGDQENEIILASVLQGFFDAVTLLLRY